jgi:hypothetical protein
LAGGAAGDWNGGPCCAAGVERAGGAPGCTGLATDGAALSSDAPQDRQKFLLDNTSAPQLGHKYAGLDGSTGSDSAHSRQNRAPALFSVPQLGHFMATFLRKRSLPFASSTSQV